MTNQNSMEIPIGQTLFGRYTVSRKLGEGYFGRVYLAQDKVLPRSIAIKELKSRFLEDPRTVQRFANDARAAAALQHINVVTVYDLQPTTDKPRFILLEYLASGSLRELLQRERRLPVARAARIASEISSALGLAHLRKIVHRDIKPENVLFTDNGTTKVCDFGIAHLPVDFGGLGFNYGEGHPGTITHRSPEQVDGKSDLDGRSDLYTVGVVLYEMLTGRHYFDYSGFKGYDDFNSAVRNHRPAPPSSLNPAIPRAMDDIVLKLLEKKREARFQSAGELVQALEQFCLLSPASRELLVRPVLTSVNSSARREGSRFRYQIKMEAVNEGNSEASWAGLTIHFLTLTSKEQLASHNIAAWGTGGSNPLQFAPDDLLWGFLEDRSWGQKRSKCLMIESVVQSWKPGHQISLEVVLTLDLPRLDAAVRAWASWKKPDGREISEGDPSWSTRVGLDQQGIPCYPLVLGFNG